MLPCLGVYPAFHSVTETIIRRSPEPYNGSYFSNLCWIYLMNCCLICMASVTFANLSSLLFHRILSSNCEYAFSTMPTIGVLFMYTVLSFNVYNL